MHNLQAKALSSLYKDSYLDSEAIYLNSNRAFKEGDIINLHRTSIRFKQYTNKKKRFGIIIFSNSNYLYASKEKVKFKLQKDNLFIRFYELYKFPKGTYIIDKMPKSIELYRGKKLVAKALLFFGDNFYIKIREVL